MKVKVKLSQKVRSLPTALHHSGSAGELFGSRSSLLFDVDFISSNQNISSKFPHTETFPDFCRATLNINMKGCIHTALVKC